MRVTDDIRYVGVNDHQVDLFEGQFEVPLGMAYNSYVILDEKVAVMDTVDQHFGKEWLENLKEALGERKPDYLVMQNWFCKTEWYRQGAPNFIAFDGSGYLHVSEDIVLILLGEPSRILDNGEYRVYVYENGLSDEIVIPKGQVAE